MFGWLDERASERICDCVVVEHTLCIQWSCMWDSKKVVSKVCIHFLCLFPHFITLTIDILLTHAMTIIWCKYGTFACSVLVYASRENRNVIVEKYILLLGKLESDKKVSNFQWMNKNLPSEMCQWVAKVHKRDLICTLYKKSWK